MVLVSVGGGPIVGGDEDQGYTRTREYVSVSAGRCTLARYQSSNVIQQLGTGCRRVRYREIIVTQGFTGWQRAAKHLASVGTKEFFFGVASFCLSSTRLGLTGSTDLEMPFRPADCTKVLSTTKLQIKVLRVNKAPLAKRLTRSQK